MEKLVAIIDEVPEYGRRLAMYLNSDRDFPYRAVVFSTAEEAECYVKNGALYAIIVEKCAEISAMKVLAGTNVKLFCLCDTKEDQNPSSLYRYGSALELERCLLEVKAEKKTPVIGFFSPAGGCEAEFLAERIAEELGRKGKVLYISLFPFGVNGRQQGDGLSEVLYFLRQNGTECKERMQAVLQCGEYMDVIGPVRWYSDLRNVTKEDIKELLREEWWDGRYRAFFLAVGMFDCVGQEILNCCDCILMPEWETVHGIEIQEEFRRQVKGSGETELYAVLREFTVTDMRGTTFEKAVEAAVKKGEEVIERYGGGNPKADVGTVGLIYGIDRCAGQK